MATGRIPTTANSPLTAKGDLFTFSTGSAKLAVGNNGETLVADSSTSTGLRYKEDYAAGKNKIINGDFTINQRAFTSNTTSGAYNFDRWLQTNGGTSGTLTITPQTFTPGAAPVSGYEGSTFIQCITAAGANTDTYALFSQRIEDVRTFAGQTATVSFWAKATSGTPKIAIETEQLFGSGGSPSSAVTTAGGTATLSTSWARYSVTVSVPSISGKTIGTTANTSSLSINLWLSAGSSFASRASSIGLQNATFQIWGVQVEDGSVATAFNTATGTIQGELAACQRYYWKWNSGTGLTASYLVAYAGSQANFTVQFPVTMRVAPSLDVVNGTNYYLFIKQTGGNVNMSTILQDSSSVSQASLYSTAGISGLTPGYAGQFYFNNASSYMAWSAEL